MDTTTPQTIPATDPWSGETYATTPPTTTQAQARAASGEACGCGYDLCGQCMRDAHQGLRRPLQAMPTPGPGRAVWSAENAAADAGDLLPPF